MKEVLGSHWIPLLALAYLAIVATVAHGWKRNRRILNALLIVAIVTPAWYVCRPPWLAFFIVVAVMEFLSAKLYSWFFHFLYAAILAVALSNFPQAGWPLFIGGALLSLLLNKWRGTWRVDIPRQSRPRSAKCHHERYESLARGVCSSCGGTQLRNRCKDCGFTWDSHTCN